MTRYKHYPYKSAWQWIVNPRQRHMIDALDREPGSFRGHDGEELKERLRLMNGWLMVRAVLVVLLSFSIVTTAVSWLLRVFHFLPASDEVMALVNLVSTIAAATSTLTLVLYMVTMRTLGQLEMDAILLLPAHRSRWGATDAPRIVAQPAPVPGPGQTRSQSQAGARRVGH